jgi:hypothetical protein
MFTMSSVNPVLNSERLALIPFELRHHFLSKQFHALPCPFGIAGSGVKIECNLVKAKFIIQFVQPTTALGWRANDGALFQMVGH